MAKFLPLFRAIMFVLIIMASLVMLGVGIYVQSSGDALDWGYTPLILISSCLTCVSLPLIWGLDCCQCCRLTSTVLFEFIWFLLLWILWAATAIISFIGSFSCGNNSNNSSDVNGVTTADTVCGFAFIGSFISWVPCFLAFIYDKVLLWYAISKASRGRPVWAVSVMEATANNIHVNPGIHVSQLVPVPSVQYQNYTTTDAPLVQSSYDGSQQIPPSAQLPSASFGQPYDVLTPPQSPPPEYTTPFPFPEDLTPIPQAQSKAYASPDHQ